MIDRIFRIGILLLFAIASVHAQAQAGRAWSLVDLANLDAGRVRWNYVASTTVELSDESKRQPLSVFDAVKPGISDASLVDTVSIKPYLLQPSAPLGTAGPIVGAVPPEIQHVALTIMGQRFVLDVIESEYDPHFDYRHVTAVVVSHPPSGYARFTVDDRNGLIAGTIHTDLHTYRIVPSGAEGTQLVFALPADNVNDEVPNRYRRILSTSSSPAEQLEKRHVQAEVIADIQPELYSDDGLLVTVRASRNQAYRLGHIDPSEASRPRAIRRLLSRLSPLTQATGEEEFEVVSVRTPDDDSERRYTIEYRQLANGLPIDPPREIVLTANGDVIEFRSMLIDPESLPELTNRITNIEALNTAVAALELRFGAAGGFAYEHHTDQDVLAYRPVRGEWTPVWRSLFSLSSNFSSGTYWVSVNILTGETIISPSAAYNDSRVTVPTAKDTRPKVSSSCSWLVPRAVGFRAHLPSI